MAAPHTSTSGEIVPRDAAKVAAPKDSVENLFERLKPAMASVLPKHVTADRLARIALGSIRKTPELGQSEPRSLVSAVMQCAVLGLEPDNGLGHAYLLPFKNRKRGCIETQLIIGYRGMMDLARRSGAISTIAAVAVYPWDEFSYRLGLSPDVHHVPGKRPPEVSMGAVPGAVTHVYAVARLKDGGVQFVVLDRDEVESYRARSRAKDSGPWVTDWIAMAKKTAIRRLFTWLPSSIEMQRASALDDEVETGRDQRSYGVEVMQMAELLGEEDVPSDDSGSAAGGSMDGWDTPAEEQ